MGLLMYQCYTLGMLKNQTPSKKVKGITRVKAIYTDIQTDRQSIRNENLRLKNII